MNYPYFVEFTNGMYINYHCLILICLDVFAMPAFTNGPNIKQKIGFHNLKCEKNLLN